MRLLEAQNAYLLANLPHANHVYSPPLSNGLTNDDAGPSIPFAIDATQDPEDGCHHYEGQDEAVLLSESLEFAETVVGKCEDVLEWPIFEGKFHRSETEMLVFNPEVACEVQPGSNSSVNCDPVRTSTRSRGIQDEEALALVEKFFLHVHIKNPILNVSDTKSMAKDVMEHGFRWDASSCLVVRNANTFWCSLEILFLIHT
jgi:hypothetical protein